MTTFINPFCTAPSLMRPQEKREPVTVEMGGCLTDDDERPFYSEEEWKRRKG